MDSSIMALSKAERSEINRNNARNSTGPKTPEGKERSRRNALKHGLRAETLTLPNEDPVSVQARVDDWFAYYQPTSPAAEHLTRQCVRYTLLADRVDAYQTALLTRQVREAEHDFELQTQEEIERLVALRQVDPASAVRQLKQSAPGCRFLRDRWKQLGDRLATRGFWDDAERFEVLWNLGFSAEPADLAQNAVACMTNLFALICLKDVQPRRIAEAFHPNAMPTSVRVVFDPAQLPTPDDARNALMSMVLEQVEWLKQNEPCLHEQFEAPARAEAAQRALVIQDPEQARLILRYMAETRTGFNRAYRDLVVTLDRDQSSEENPNKPIAERPEDQAVSQDEGPVESISTAAESREETPPNEANPRKVAEKSLRSSSSDVSVLEPDASFPWEGGDGRSLDDAAVIAMWSASSGATSLTS